MKFKILEMVISCAILPWKEYNKLLALSNLLQFAHTRAFTLKLKGKNRVVCVYINTMKTTFYSWCVDPHDERLSNCEFTLKT